MHKVTLFFSLLALTTILNVNAQSLFLSVKQQNEDFTIFKGGLQEGHSGLNYFIDKVSFDKKCDSIQKTFYEGLSTENYYLKLRYLITLLNHGHTRISLPTNGNVNYKMAVLDSTKLYLPFEFLIINNQLIINEDCSREQLFPKYSVVKSINNINAKDLIKEMLPYMPADGINQTFKTFSLYNYFYFHYLFNIFYPQNKGVKIELVNNSKRNYTDYYIELLKAKTIDSIYFAKNKRSISQYDKQLDYKSNLPNQTAYLKVSSFYKGLIEQFGQKYEPFLDSTFADIKSKNLQNLIIDLRNNEGGGDGYDFLLLSYLINTPILSDNVAVPGRQFNFIKYAVNVSDDLKAFIENPNEFLQNDTSLILKEQYTGQIIFPTSKNLFNGKVIVLTNGGSFSASTNFRQTSKREIFFVGEENGGDIYSNTECAGQGYSIKLPNSSIVIDMPLLCAGLLKRNYPKKRLPDYEVYDKITYLKANKDNVLDFAIKMCKEE
jgi:Peptidase family S41